MTKYEIEIEDVPDGYEPVRFGLMKEGDWFIDSTGRLSECDIPWTVPRLILRKVKRWRKPSLPDDAGKPCRFSDDGKTWSSEGKLTGWLYDSYPWKTVGGTYRYCEVEE